MKQKHTSKKFVVRLLLAILAFLMLTGVCVYTVSSARICMGTL